MLSLPRNVQSNGARQFDYDYEHEHDYEQELAPPRNSLAGPFDYELRARARARHEEG